MLKRDLEKEFELLQEKYKELKSDYVSVINDFAEKEKEKIKQLADVLGLFQIQNLYGYSREQEKFYDVDNWGAIFFAIGKLKNFQEGLIEKRDYDRETRYRESEYGKLEEKYREVCQELDRLETQDRMGKNGTVDL